MEMPVEFRHAALQSRCPNLRKNDDGPIRLKEDLNSVAPVEIQYSRPILGCRWFLLARVLPTENAPRPLHFTRSKGCGASWGKLGT